MQDEIHIAHRTLANIQREKPFRIIDQFDIVQYFSQVLPVAGEKIIQYPDRVALRE
jgi:hypothetical protein